MRIVFTIYIVLMHGESIFRDTSAGKLFGGGYIGVEFFFIVSGYYIGEKAEAKVDVIDFLKARLKRLYPHYFLSLTLATFMHNINSISDFLSRLRDLFWSLLMLQNMGLNITLYNGYLWYVTYLIFCGTLVYCALVKFNRKIVNVLSVIFVITFYSLYTYFFKTIDNSNSIIILPLSVYRAFAGILWGTLIYKIVNRGYFNHEKYDFIKKIVVSAFLFLGLLMSFLNFHTPYDLLIVLCFAICIGVSATMKSIDGSNCFKKVVVYIGRKTYPLYCYQVIAFFIVRKITFAKSIFGVLFVCIAISLLFDQIINMVKSRKSIMKHL